MRRRSQLERVGTTTEGLYGSGSVCPVPHLCRTRMESEEKRRERQETVRDVGSAVFPGIIWRFPGFFLVGDLWARQDLNLQPTDYESDMVASDDQD